MTLTIGIVNYNTKKDLERCINSILHNPPDCSYEITIVDNDSKDGSKEFLKRIKIKNITYIFNEKNLGFGKACNQIAKTSSTSYILFLNPDVEITENSVNRLIDFLRNNKQTGAVTGKLLYPNKSFQLSCRQFPTIFRVLFGRESFLRKISPNNNFSKQYLMTELNYDKIQFPDWARGAVMLFRTELFRKIGGFDERFFLFFEDTDICFRLKKAGYRIAYFPEAIFYHKLGSSTQKERLKTKIIHNISMFYYIRKNMNYSFTILSILFIALIIRLVFIFPILTLKEI